MNNASRNRNHPDHKYEQQILKTDLCHTTVTNMQELVSIYATEFDLIFIDNKQDKPIRKLSDAIGKLYETTKSLFEANNITFDNHWVK